MSRAGLLVALAVGFACSSRDAPPRADDSIGAPLMSALLQARDLHHLADVHLAAGDLDAAVDQVRRILSVRFPVGAPEGEDVRLDARARLANLLAGAGEPAEALRVVDEGIAAASRESYFLANLYAVRGHLLRDAAERADDAEQATRLRREAIDALTRSHRMAERVQQELGR